tara:strand:+ start:1595 stop:3073 length:1479 start_codon:yes stop_codon:yes gene_type:complete
MPLILNGNVASALGGGFNVTNSVRFEQANDPYFQKSPTGDGNQRTFTFSVWLKMDLHGSGDTHKIFDTGTAANYFTFYYTEEPYLVVKGRISSSTVLELIPTQAFRDPTAWKHLYIVVDTTQSTASDRCKIYINGNQVTDFSTATYPNQNTDFEIQDASNPFRLGADKNLGDEHFDGYMAEYVFVDGAAQAISDFGEFSEDTPNLWIPKDVSTINVNPSHANGNGFYLNFQNSSNLGVDSSGNTNFSVNNLDATDQVTDVPTNNFAIWNPLDRWSNNTDALESFLSEGNCDFDVGTSAKGLCRSTIGVNKSKWYWEVKINNKSKGFYGFVNANAFNGSTSPHDASDSRGIFYYEATPDFRGNSGDGAKTTGIISCSNGDILNFALDMDNYAFYIGKNGTYMNSGNPTSGSSKTGAISELFTNGSQYLSNFGEVFPALYVSSTSGSIDASANFGNPVFSISSGNADGNGYGNFEYAPPSGYFSLCTKNLAEFG